MPLVLDLVKKMMRIETETIVLVKWCHLRPAVLFSYLFCSNQCPYFQKKEECCGWKEYVTQIFKEKEMEDEINGGKEYHKIIKCGCCFAEVDFVDTDISEGDYEQCERCGTPHIFLRQEEEGYYVFALPIKWQDE